MKNNGKPVKILVMNVHRLNNLQVIVDATSSFPNIKGKKVYKTFISCR